MDQLFNSIALIAIGVCLLCIAIQQIRKDKTDRQSKPESQSDVS